MARARKFGLESGWCDIESRSRDQSRTSRRPLVANQNGHKIEKPEPLILAVPDSDFFWKIFLGKQVIPVEDQFKIEFLQGQRQECEVFRRMKKWLQKKYRVNRGTNG